MMVAVLFVGLGVMGAPIAGHIAGKGHKVYVYNRTDEKAHAHAATYGTTAVCKDQLHNLRVVSVVITCVPTSEDVAALSPLIGPSLMNTDFPIWVDCTSGDPDASVAIAKELKDAYGCEWVDCPISGGPIGAENGTLTSMVSGSPKALSAVNGILTSFCTNIVEVGNLPGMGHSVKALNNLMNTAHLLLGAEALLVLKKRGISPEAALRAINGSSGASKKTQTTIPDHVLSRRFAHGFKLGLMAKDCHIAEHLRAREVPDDVSILSRVSALLDAAGDLVGLDVDYSRAVQLLEMKSGSILCSDALDEEKE